MGVGPLTALKNRVTRCLPALLRSAYRKLSEFAKKVQKVPQNVPQKDSGLRPAPYGESSDF